MSTLQAYLVLCVAALAVAAPQLKLGGLRSVSNTREIASDDIDRAEVVSQVVAALTPEIQSAVAEALTALQTTSLLTSGLETDSGSGFSPRSGEELSSNIGSRLSSNAGLKPSSNYASGPSSNAGSKPSSKYAAGPSSNAGSKPSLHFASGPSSNSGSKPSSNYASGPFSNAGSFISSANDAPSSTGYAFGPTAKPVYSFEYKVAAEEDKTYLSQSEERDGDNLSGFYSYVDPYGALITVNYQAGPEGFSQTIDQQDGFISIRPKPMSPSTSGTPSSSSDSVVSAKSVSGPSSSSDSGLSTAFDSKSPDTTGSKLSDNSKLGPSDNSGFDSSVNAESTNSLFSPSANDAAGFSTKTESSSTVSQKELIAQIIASLKPQITAAVVDALYKTEKAAPVQNVPAAKISPAGSQPASNYASGPSSFAGSKPSSNYASGPSSNAGSKPSYKYDSGPSSNAGSKPSSKYDKGLSSNAGSKPSSNYASGLSSNAEKSFQVSPNARLNSVGGFGAGSTTGPTKGSTIGSPVRSVGTYSTSAQSETKTRITGDISSTFGNGLYVKIKTPHSDISY